MAIGGEDSIILVESTASSSCLVEPTQTKPQGQQRKKVYQPKYTSVQAQKRSVRQVIIPKILLDEQRISQGDTYKWVERQVVEPRHSVDGSPHKIA